MEMDRGRVRVTEYRRVPYSMSYGIVEVDPPDRPHEEWALHHFDVDTYEKAAKKIADENDFEGSDLKESFENGFWTISDDWHSGTGKTKDAALVDYAYDECYNYESDW